MRICRWAVGLFTDYGEGEKVGVFSLFTSKKVCEDVQAGVNYNAMAILA